MHLNDNIERMMKEMVQSMHDGEILALAIFDRDGNPIAYAVQDDMKGEDISAAGGGLLSMSARIMGSLNMAPAHRTIIETTKGNILIEDLHDGLGIVVVVSPGISIGRAKLLLEKLSRRFREAISL